MFRAMDQAREGITISDVTLPDNPLIYVNQGFRDLTGYSLDEIMTRNCRYLQGVDTDAATVQAIREAISAKQPIQVELLNYKRDGTRFWNRLNLTPIFNAEGLLTNYIGIQEDITMLRAKLELEQRMQVSKAATHALIRGEEQEKQRIGIELHDNINQLLGAVNLYLDLVRSGTDLEIDPLKEAQKILVKAIGEIRLVSRGLVGPTLDGPEIDTILQDHISGLQPIVPFQISFRSLQSQRSRLNAQSKQAVYRIFQEHMNNVIKYAGAKNVEVILDGDADNLNMKITDDGVGFDTVTRRPGIGIRNMKSRAAAFGGDIMLTSVIGRGTTLQVTMPLLFEE